MFLTSFRFPTRDAVQKIVSKNFCAAAVELHLVKILLVGSSHLDKSLSNCILLGMSVTSLCGSLGSNPARQRSLEYFDSFSNQSLLLRFLSSKRNNIQNLINDTFPHERMLLVSQSESRPVRPELSVIEQCRQCQL